MDMMLAAIIMPGCILVVACCFMLCFAKSLLSGQAAQNTGKQGLDEDTRLALEKMREDLARAAITAQAEQSASAASTDHQSNIDSQV